MNYDPESLTKGENKNTDNIFLQPFSKHVYDYSIGQVNIRQRSQTDFIRALVCSICSDTHSYHGLSSRNSPTLSDTWNLGTADPLTL